MVIYTHSLSTKEVNMANKQEQEELSRKFISQDLCDADRHVKGVNPEERKSYTIEDVLFYLEKNV